LKRKYLIIYALMIIGLFILAAPAAAADRCLDLSRSAFYVAGIGYEWKTSDSTSYIFTVEAGHPMVTGEVYGASFGKKVVC